MKGTDIFNAIRDRKLPYFIFEIGGNFEKLDDAKRLIDLAKTCGADAVKLQHFRAETITSKKAIFEMENTGVISQYDHFKKYELNESITRDVYGYAAQAGLAIFSTPSHPDDIDFLEKFDNSVYKIGSDDATNLPFIKYAARTQKPVILSTGMCTMSEVQRAVDAVLEEGNSQLVLLHCITQYPTYPDQVNLRAMQSMMRVLPEIPIGYSDHTKGIDACYAAACLGAKVLEFHFTYDKNADGPDHMLSKEPTEAKMLVDKVTELMSMLGDGLKRPMSCEMNTRKNNRKSIVITAAIEKGEKINTANIAIKRPGYGISNEFFYDVIGKTASRRLDADEVLTWESLS